MLMIGLLALIVFVVFSIWNIKHQAKKEGFEKSNNYGFSYIAIGQSLNLLLSLILGILVTFISTNFIGNQSYFLSILFGIVTAVLIFYLLNFSIIKFRNIALIAKTNSEILKMLQIKTMEDKREKK